MYNKNGIKFLNNNLVVQAKGSTANCYLTLSSVVSSDPLVDTGGNTYYGTLRLAYSSNGMLTGPVILNAITNTKITGHNDVARLVISNNPSTSNYVPILGFSIGYRDSAFNENTTSLPSTLYNSKSSISLTQGLPTVTVVNNEGTDIVINEIDVLMRIYNHETLSTNPILFAGFHFPDVTIASNESYTFTIMHKNS